MKKLLALCFVVALVSGTALAQVGLTGYPAPGQLPGTATNNSAAAGNVGELKSSLIVAGSAISLASSIPVDLTSLSLTAGDWDVTCEAQFTPGATTTINVLVVSIGTTSATLNQTPGNFAQIGLNNTITPGSNNYMTMKAGPTQVSLATTTTYFCPVVGYFGTSTLTVWGILRARRMR